MGVRWKHFKTVYNHKKFVYQECRACGIIWQGITHDLSKFSPIEFTSKATILITGNGGLILVKMVKSFVISFLISM